MTEDEDFCIKSARLNNLGETQTPRIFPVIRRFDREPSPDCELCGQEFYTRNTIFERRNGFVWSTKDYPYVPGDSMITLRNHRDGYKQLTEQEFKCFLELADVACSIYQRLPEVRRVQVLQAVGGRTAGQGIVDHFHAHIFPTYDHALENQTSIVSNTNFIIQDASSYYISRMMQKENPAFFSQIENSTEFPGGLVLKRKDEEKSDLFNLLQTLEEIYFNTVSSVSNRVKKASIIDDQISIIAEAADISTDNPRKKRILTWMLRTFNAPVSTFFGYNLSFNNQRILFLPRSGLVGAKRIGPPSIFGNIHWATRSLGNETTPTVYTAPYTDYPEEFKKLHARIFEYIKSTIGSQRGVHARAA